MKGCYYGTVCFSEYLLYNNSDFGMNIKIQTWFETAMGLCDLVTPYGDLDLG